MRVVFRADASARIGGGHVYRCLALADALSERGATCVIATRPEAHAIVPALIDARHETVRVNLPETADEAEQARELGANFGAVELLVVDHYGLGPNFEESSRNWAVRVAAIDDAPDRPHVSDIVVDHTHGREAQEYAAAAPGAEILAGSDYALLRPQFAQRRASSLAARADRHGRLERVLIAFGASDPENYTGAGLNTLLEVPNLRVTVLIGAAHPQKEALAKRVSGAADARLFEATDDVAQLMENTDVAVGGGGGMAWERCVMGVPALVARMAGNQRPVIDALESAGAARALGAGPGSMRAELALAMRDLQSNPEAVVAMSNAAASLCDGLGAVRVTDFLIQSIRPKLCAGGGRSS